MLTEIGPIPMHEKRSGKYAFFIKLDLWCVWDTDSRDPS